MGFEIAWIADEEAWAQARSLAAERISVGADEVLLDDFLVVGTLWFTVGGRFTRPIALTDAAVEAALPWNVWRGRASPSAATTNFGAGFEVVLFEFAWQLALIVEPDGLPAGEEGTSMCYDMFDEAFSLCFAKVHGAIWIASDQQDDQGWVFPVPEPEFFRGAHRFLREFASELSWRVPGILDAQVCDPLRPYAVEASE